MPREITRENRQRMQEMQTRIREFRKLRGMTLKELADKIKTTPQTVQRLETANMTVSTDWLEKIARALLVEPRDLIGSDSSRTIQMLGRIRDDGRVVINTDPNQKTLSLDSPVDDPVAVILDQSIGEYEEGSILVANRFRPQDVDGAHGVDCLVAIDDRTILLRKLIHGRNGGWTLVSPENGKEVRYDQTIKWIARIKMVVRYV